MLLVNSISPISKIIPTNGSNPALVLCEDLTEYYCKYSRYTPANKLLIEFISSSFLKVWNVPTPDFAFVEIAAEHVPAEILSNRISRNDFLIPTFGSQHLEHSHEIDESVILSWNNKRGQVNKIINKEDFLRIGLFDLWMANEDRNHNNYNLMISAKEEGSVIYAIDHEKCFNSGILDNVHPIQILTEDESILKTDLVPILFNNEFHLEDAIRGILEGYSNSVNECKHQLPGILQQIPERWNINTDEIATLLEKNIFAPEWMELTVQTFKEYLN
ncbi:MAG: HipA family kinase [Bacteroidia bacterium]